MGRKGSEGWKEDYENAGLCVSYIRSGSKENKASRERGKREGRVSGEWEIQIAIRNRSGRNRKEEKRKGRKGKGKVCGGNRGKCLPDGGAARGFAPPE